MEAVDSTFRDKVVNRNGPCCLLEVMLRQRLMFCDFLGFSPVSSRDWLVGPFKSVPQLLLVSVIG